LASRTASVAKAHGGLGHPAPIHALLPSARYIELLHSTHATQRQILREKGTPAAELGLLDPSAPTDQTLDAMVANPVLVDRPTNVTRQGVKPCRP